MVGWVESHSGDSVGIGRLSLGSSKFWPLNEMTSNRQSPRAAQLEKIPTAHLVAVCQASPDRDGAYHRELIERLRPSMLLAVRRRGVPPEQRGDVLYRALTKVVDKLQTLDDQARVEAWARRIADNEAIDNLRRSSRDQRESLDDHEPMAFGAGTDPSLEYDVLECFETFVDALEDPLHREVFLAHRFEGLSYAELAERGYPASFRRWLPRLNEAWWAHVDSWFVEE